MNFPLKLNNKKKRLPPDIQKQEALRTLQKLQKFNKRLPDHYQESLHTLQKLRKKWPPDHYLALRVSCFYTDTESFFEEHKDTISFYLAVSTREKINCGCSIFIFKKRVSVDEMFEFLESHNPYFPGKDQIKGYQYLKP